MAAVYDHPAHDEARELRSVLERLQLDFPAIAPDALEADLRRAADQFERAPVRAYVPLLVEKDVRSRLRHALHRARP